MSTVIKGDTVLFDETGDFYTVISVLKEDSIFIDLNEEYGEGHIECIAGYKKEKFIKMDSEYVSLHDRLHQIGEISLSSKRDEQYFFKIACRDGGKLSVNLERLRKDGIISTHIGIVPSGNKTPDVEKIKNTLFSSHSSEIYQWIKQEQHKSIHPNIVSLLKDKKNMLENDIIIEQTQRKI